jgi:uncharacterized membrane protein YciS (DUF1049 family)
MGFGNQSSIMIVVSVWLLSIGIGIPGGFNVITDEYYCQVQESDFHLWWNTILAFIVPLFLIIVSYICILVKLKAKIQKKKDSISSPRNIEMVALEDHPDQDDLPFQSSGLNPASWEIVRNLIRQKSFQYERNQVILLSRMLLRTPVQTKNGL